VHDYSTLLEVAAELRASGVTLLIVGQGHGFRRMREEAGRRGLDDVVFRPPQPRARLGESLAVADVHLVTLAPGMGRFVVPSKLYGVMAAGRPVIFVGGTDSEIPALLDRHACGFAVVSGDAAGLARTIRMLEADEQLRRRAGSNARRAFDACFARPVALAAWRRVIEAAARA
jgi:glycosyltransferase involved in cell wall biosynthesis